MINYNRRNISLVSLAIAIIISITINFILVNLEGKEEKEINSSLVLKTSLINPINEEKNIIKEEKDEIIGNQYKKYNKWRIEIPAIKLNAPIMEGTTKEIMRKTVGHFEETGNWDGNVCLAAHNRGYKYNYFQEIKKLNIGDCIKYTNENGTRMYQVVTNEIIKETDWKYIQETEDNRITLITCVENMPEYRQCIQAVEII